MAFKWHSSVHSKIRTFALSNALFHINNKIKMQHSFRIRCANTWFILNKFSINILEEEKKQTKNEIVFY